MVSVLGVASGSTRWFTTKPESYLVSQGRRRRTVSYHFFLDRPMASSVAGPLLADRLSLTMRDAGDRNDPGGCMVPFASCHQPTGACEYLTTTTESSSWCRRPATGSDTVDTATTGPSRPE